MARITVTVNGKDYIVHAPVAFEGSNGGLVSYSYRSTRNGEAFGPVRTASTNAKASSVGGQLVAQAQEFFNANHDAMIAEAVRKLAEIRATGATSYAHPTVKLITRH